jgi:RimJ/RimL family protein N-acetyltransferase
MIFRPLGYDDLLWFVETRNSVRDMLHNPTEFSIDDAIEWFPTATSKYWIIVLEGASVGYFRITETSPQKVLIGADISPIFQGKRIATIAYPRFVEEILIPSGIKELELRVLKRNVKALGLYRKLGFVVDDETDTDFHMRVFADNLKTFRFHQ